MMRTKAILILAIVTVVAVAGAAASVYQREGAHGLPRPPSALFPGLLDKVNDVAKVSVASPESSFTIEKQSSGDWQMVEKGGYPVLFETIKQAVVGIASMRPLEAKTARSERYARIKVVDPRADGDTLSKGILLRLLGADDGEIAAVIVGKTRSIQTSGRAGWYYVRKAQEPQSWLVAARIEVFDKANSWLDTDTVRIDRKRVRAVSNRQPNGDMVEISRPNPDQIDFKIDNLPDGSKMLHETIANSLGAALGYLSFDDVKPATEVDFSDPIVATFRTFDGLVVKVEVVTRDKTNWARFHAEFDPEGLRLDAVPEKHKEKMKAEADVKKEAERINARFGSWAYDLPKYKAEDFTTPMSKLAVEEKPDNS